VKCFGGVRVKQVRPWRGKHAAGRATHICDYEKTLFTLEYELTAPASFSSPLFPSFLPAV